MENESIFVNQIGYRAADKKYAFVKAAAVKETAFCLKDNAGKVVFEGELIKTPDDKLAGESYFTADFSDFTDDGSFVCCVGDQESFPINIGKKAKTLYSQLFYSSLRYFYLSRCGQEIDGEEWSHKACHTDVAQVYGTGEKKQVAGGWHDAGDYGRYIVAGSKAVMDLLLAYEAVGREFGQFDILSEVRFELEWMLQMQREDGAVYHKISCYHFCAFINPDEEKDELVLAPVSTAATADFAGCLAYAYEFFKSTDKAFADTLLAAALKAQDYLNSHPDELYKNPQEITTGGYGDWNVKDERYFALCSLFAATGKKEYVEKAFEIKKQALAQPDDPECPWKIKWGEFFGWAMVSGYGTEILLKNREKIKKVFGSKAKSIIEELKAGIISHADDVLGRCQNSAFKMGAKFLMWGSNGYVADESHMLLLAYDLTKNGEYYQAAVNNINYLLGCNPLGICYVSGNGSNSPKYPHHRPSGAIKKVMPGMLAGGPSAGLQDAVAKEKLQGKAPLLCYIDEVGSYSTNEVAIYWNSPFVYALAKLKLI